MAPCGSNETRRAGRLKQAGRTAAALVLIAWTVAGCGPVERLYDSRLSPDTPIDWWHDLQGGQIATNRPPPPGVDEPYPNLAAVPPRPTPTPPAQRVALAGSLAAERDRARRDMVQDPVGVAAPSARPARAPAPAPVPDPNASIVVLDGASAPPPPPAPSPPAPPPPAPPAGRKSGRATLPPGTAPAPAGTQTPVVSGPLPDLPGAPPPLPSLPGLPAAPGAPAPAKPLQSVVVAFAPGSADVPVRAEAALRDLAARRANDPVRITAGGEARSASPEAQAAALPLALRRVRAIGAQLVAAGVPATALREEATAIGRGGGASLLH